MATSREALSDNLFPSRTLNVSIARHPDRVYDFASDPENLPRWATGLGASITRKGEGWVVDTPEGPVKIRFARKNGFGVLDHYVTVGSGAEIYVPMRVLANGQGSEVLFTLYKLPGVPDEKFAEDVKLVQRDLLNLKAALEQE